MSAFDYIRANVLTAAFDLLPEKMCTPAEPAEAMLLAIGLQESRMTLRRQIGGPARSLWQFEMGGGVRGVLRHPASKPHISAVLRAMAYGETEEIAFAAMEHNDVLACCFARLLLWTHPRPLPQRAETDYAWTYYLDTWRPGKPHRETWGAFYAQAWDSIKGD